MEARDRLVLQALLAPAVVMVVLDKFLLLMAQDAFLRAVVEAVQKMPLEL